MYKFYNANKNGNFINDCVIRAISVAEHKTWEETFEELSLIAQYEGTMVDDVKFVEKYLDRRYPRKCQYNSTVGDFMDEHPYGTYLITMQGHITVIVDGVLIDTFDCRNRRMWCSWNVM